jgi:ADP-ribose pyrophosphatase
MRVDIRDIQTPYEFRLPNGRVLFKIEEAVLSHERFSGPMGSEITRVNFERGDGVGVLLYDEAERAVILVEQFRFPVHRREGASPEGNAWLLEIVAGIKDGDGPSVARKEVLEETGYELSHPPEHLSTFYLSPGGSSEQMELYLARVRKSPGGPHHGGVASEGEDIRVHALPLDKAIEQVSDGRIRDAKTIVALLMLRQRDLGRKQGGSIAERVDDQGER